MLGSIIFTGGRLGWTHPIRSGPICLYCSNVLHTSMTVKQILDGPRSVMGEWRSLGNPSSGGTEMDRAYSFFSQPTFVVPVHGKPGRFVFMADQWDTANLGASR